VFFFGPLSLLRRVPSLLILGALVYLVVSGVQVEKASRLPTAVDAIAPARAIVVLGAPAPGGTPGVTLLGRLQQALLLYKAQRAPQVLVSDPTSASATAAATTATANPAQAAARWLESQGVPAHAVVTLPAGTAAAALQSTAALLGPGAHVIVVADAIDALWTTGAARAAGLQATVSPALGSEQPVYSEVIPLVKQAAGVAVGRVIGYGHTSWASP
jgi:uncharacterized SAM-binding protein YcdF (DUF218 family)